RGQNSLLAQFSETGQFRLRLLARRRADPRARVISRLSSLVCRQLFVLTGCANPFLSVLVEFSRSAKYWLSDYFLFDDDSTETSVRLIRKSWSDKKHQSANRSETDSGQHKTLSLTHYPYHQYTIAVRASAIEKAAI